MAKNITRSFSIRNSICYSSRTQMKKIHWSDAARLKNNVEKALEHFDDLYASVYAEKWPSLRLALLTPPKYVAIPNSFTGDVDKICQQLESRGAFPIHPLWIKQKERLDKQRKEFNVAKDVKRIVDMEKTMEAIAVTKQAEELDTIYKNAPPQRIPSPFGGGDNTRRNRRVLSDVGEAVVEHVAATQLKGVDDFMFDSEYYSVYNKQLNPSPSESLNPFLFTNPSNCTRLDFPPFLRPYTFEPGNPSDFPSALRNSSSGLREYLCVNGASIVPIIALDLKPDVNILDLCAGPGTKALMSLLTMTPSKITCNDLERSRLYKVNLLMAEFLGNKAPDNMTFTKINAAFYPPEPIYDRVLADVPCLSDRVSCTIANNNIFNPRRMKERLNLVKVQQKILESAFKCLSKKPGSSCVYSTCSLSPVENDGAVMAALRETEVTSLAVDLMGLWNVLAPLQSSGLFYMSRTKFGFLIEPNVMSNFGPMYVSRIIVLPERQLKSTDNQQCDDSLEMTTKEN